MKLTLRIASSLALIGGFLYLFLANSQPELLPAMIIGSRIGQSMIFNTTLISVNRLFPTLFIANAYGICNFCAHIIACLSPFVAEISNPYPYCFFVSFVFVALFASFFLTELDDAEAMKRGGCDLAEINNLGSKKMEKNEIDQSDKMIDGEETYKIE
jgi:hypothetical protein